MLVVQCMILSTSINMMPLLIKPLKNDEARLIMMILRLVYSSIAKPTGNIDDVRLRIISQLRLSRMFLKKLRLELLSYQLRSLGPCNA